MSGFVSVNGLRCAYEKRGMGPDLVLLHGWGQSRAFWKGLLEPLARSHTVHTLDLPGFGLSDVPPTVWGVPDYAAFVHTLVRTLELASPALLGHSFGGKVAAYYAAHYPVSKLVLYSASGLPTRSFHKTIHGYLVQALRYMTPNTLYRLHAVMFKPPHYQNTLRVERARSRRMLAVYLGIYQADLTPVLPNIRAKTLLIYGRRDYIVPFSVGLRLAYLVPHAQLVALEQATHFAHFEVPEQILTSVETFLVEP